MKTKGRALRQIVVALIFCSTSVFADGFYFDAKNNRYFTSGRLPLLMRGSSNYLEVSVDDNGFQPYSKNLTLEKEGMHSVRFRISDPLLNWNPQQIYSIFVDLTGPVSRERWDGPHYRKDSKIFVNDGARLTLQAQDTFSGVSKILYEENGKSVEYTKPIGFKKEGDTELKYSSVDHVGNQEPWKIVKFTVDNSPPTTTLKVLGETLKLGKNNYVNSGAQIELTALDAQHGFEGSGLDKIQYQINGGPITIYQAPIPVTDIKTEIRYRAMDELANTEEWKLATLLQDTTPPTLAIEKQGNFIAMGGVIYATPGFSISVSAHDTESGLKEYSFSQDGKTFNTSKTNSLVFKDPGEYQFIAKAIDQVGNTASADTYSIIIDALPPQTSIRENSKLIATDAGLETPLPNTIELTSVDAQGGCGVDHIEYSYDGKEFNRYKSPLDPSQWPVQKRTLYYRAIDKLRNKEPVKSVVIQIKKPNYAKNELFVEQDLEPNVPLSQLRKPGSRGQP